MASPRSWFSSNSARAYPFVRRTVNVPDNAGTILGLANEIVVDCGFVLGAQSGFTATDSVYMSRIYRASGVIYFVFESTAPILSGSPLTFSRPVGGTDWKAEFLDSGSSGLSESSDGPDSDEECDEPLWSGFLVTGRATEIDALLADGEELVRGTNGGVVEPTLLQNLNAGMVSRLALANDDRTRADAPDDCDPVSYPYETGAIRINARCLVGEILFVAGHNALVRQGDTDASITFAAVVGAGAGEPCSPVQLFDSEVPPTGSNLLEGGPRCVETVRSINGIGGRQFTIVSGVGASVVDYPDEAKIVVSIDMSGLVTCDEFSTVSESC